MMGIDLDANDEKVFPWLCFKCGEFFSGPVALIAHLKKKRHMLTKNQKTELVNAVGQVTRLLQSK
jgi:hypothetical protein